MDFTAGTHFRWPCLSCGTLLISFKHWITFFVCAMDYLSILLKDILVLSKFCQLHFKLLAAFLCVYVPLSYVSWETSKPFSKVTLSLSIPVSNEWEVLFSSCHAFDDVFTDHSLEVGARVHTVHIMPYHSSSCAWLVSVGLWGVSSVTVFDSS